MAESQAQLGQEGLGCCVGARCGQGNAGDFGRHGLVTWEYKSDCTSRARMALERLELPQGVWL